MKNNWWKLFIMLGAVSLIACSSNPSNPELCGNNLIDSGEACDDGNLFNGDACSASCQLSFKSKDLGQHSGKINYLYSGKIDSQNSLDLLLISSKGDKRNIDWYSGFLLEVLEPKNIVSFLEFEPSLQGNIQRRLLAYQAGDANNDGFTDFVYSLLEQEPLMPANQYRLKSTLALFQNDQKGDYVSQDVFYGSIEKIVNPNEEFDGLWVVEKLRFAEMVDSGMTPDLAINLVRYTDINTPIGERDNCYLEKQSENNEDIYTTNFCPAIAGKLPSSSEIAIKDFTNFGEVLFFDKQIYFLKAQQPTYQIDKESPAITTPSKVNQVEINYITGDSAYDLLVLSGNQLLLYPNLGNNTFGAPQTISSLNISHFEPGDFDRDGLTDILAISPQNNGEIFLLHNNGDGTFASGSLLKNTGTITAQHLVDADEDGDLDLVYAVGSEIFFLENQI